MPRGKQWTTQQEAELKNLIDQNKDIKEIANQLGKTPGAIIIKSQRMGLKPQTNGYLNTSLPLPRGLPSVEETLKILAGALKASTKPGLDRLEVQRIQATATLAKTYKEILTDYINYRGIEQTLMEIQQENARLLSEASAKDAAKPDPSANA